MERNAIKLAKNTLVVSLPAKWCKEQQVRKGSALALEIQGAILRIAATASASRSLSVHCPSNPELAARVVGWAYKSGIDEIRLTRATPRILPRVKQELLALSGYEMVSSSGTNICIRAVSRLNAQELTVLESRMWYILQEMIAAQLHGDRRELLVYERDIDALSNTCKRIIAQQPINGAVTLQTYALIRELEKVADVLSTAKLSSSAIRDTQRLLLRLQRIRQTSDTEAVAQCLAFPWVEHAKDALLSAVKELASPVLALAISAQVQENLS